MQKKMHFLQENVNILGFAGEIEQWQEQIRSGHYEASHFANSFV